MQATPRATKPTHEQQVLRLARKRTLLRARDLTAQGLPTVTLTRLVQAGCPTCKAQKMSVLGKALERALLLHL